MQKSIRELGMTIGTLQVGEKNSITDVKGVKVGHVTLKEHLKNNEAVATGVTAILPHEGNLFKEKVPAAAYVLNGFGKTTGLVQIEELGLLESPIMLTNTLSVPAVTEGTLQYMLEENKEIGNSAGTVNIVVGECNDSFLNDIRGFHVRPIHAIEAIKNASDNRVEEGAVGAGTGMSCFGWKGGIGSSSRKIQTEKSQFTMGTLVLSNFGLPKELTILGKNVGAMIQPEKEKIDDGSIIIIVATDAPMDSRQLKRIAKRASLGLARTGAIAHHGSGDIIIAFSNGNKFITGENEEQISLSIINERNKLMSLLFQGVIESVEEAVLNSLFMAETTFGRQNHRREQIPVNKILKFLREK